MFICCPFSICCCDISRNLVTEMSPLWGTAVGMCSGYSCRNCSRNWMIVMFMLFLSILFD